MTVRVLQGDVRAVLATLPAKSVHVCVTSPPYWSLRNYGCPPQVWGGSSDCDHVWGPPLVDHKRGQDAGDTTRAGNTVARVCPPTTQQGPFCTACGAWRGELGSEPTLSLFVSHLVTVFEAVRRVLRDDGTLWVNLGSSYLPDGNDAMAPARFALAMQATGGWVLRSEITLCKLSPMPESVTGSSWQRCRTKVGVGAKDVLYGAEANEHRGLSGAQGQRGHGGETGQAEWADCPGCAKCSQNGGYVQRWGSGRPSSATEKLFLFAKAGQRYFFDQEVVRVPGSPTSHGGAPMWSRGPKYEGLQEGGEAPGLGQPATNGRNLWNYLLLSPEPLKRAHYAAFGRAIPRLAIQAGTSERGCCQSCGAPWLRVTKRENIYNVGDASVQQVRGGTTPRGVRGGQTEDGRTAPDVQGVRQGTSSSSMAGEPGAGTRTAAPLSGAERRASGAGQAGLPGGEGQGAERRLGETLQIDARGPSDAARGTAPVRADGARSPHQPGALSEAVGVAQGSDGDIHAGGLAAGRRQPGVPLLLLPPELHEGPAGDDGSRDPVEQGWAAYPGEHRGGLPGMQLPEVEPAGAFGVTSGWRQSCRCPAHEPVPSTVLDCFGGSGTTGIEANALGRSAVLVELQEKYVAITHQRLSEQPLSLFAWEGPEAVVSGGGTLGPGEEAARE